MHWKKHLRKMNKEEECIENRLLLPTQTKTNSDQSFNESKQNKSEKKPTNWRDLTVYTHCTVDLRQIDQRLVPFIWILCVRVHRLPLETQSSQLTRSSLKRKRKSNEMRIEFGSASSSSNQTSIKFLKLNMNCINESEREKKTHRENQRID